MTTPAAAMPCCCRVAAISGLYASAQRTAAARDSTETAEGGAVQAGGAASVADVRAMSSVVVRGADRHAGGGAGVASRGGSGGEGAGANAAGGKSRGPAS